MSRSLACMTLALVASIAVAAPPKYVSALEGYPRYADQAAASWKTSNDVVARAGGWKAYAREAQAKAPQTPLAAPSAPASHSHSH